MKKQLFFILLISIVLFIEKVNGHKFDEKQNSKEINHYKEKKNCPRRHFHDDKNQKHNKNFPRKYLRRNNKTDECNEKWRRHKKDELKHHPYERRDHNKKYDKNKNYPYEKKWGQNKGKKWKKGRRKCKKVCKIILFILFLAILLGIKKLCRRFKNRRLSPRLMRYLNSPYPKNIPFTPIVSSVQNNNNLNTPMIELNNVQNNNNNSNISYINPYIPSRKL